MNQEQLNQKHKFLNLHVFRDLKKNPDIENSSMVSFNEFDFEIVLERVMFQKIGIYGIETSLNGEYFAIKTYEEYRAYPQDANWYTAAFQHFKSLKLNLRYSASYYVSANNY